MASGIDYLTVIFSAVVRDTPLEGALDSRVVVFNELILEILENEGRFS